MRSFDSPQLRAVAKATATDGARILPASLADWLPLPQRQYDRAFAWQHRLLVLAEGENGVTVACADPAVLPPLLASLREAHEGRELSFVRIESDRLLEYLARLGSELPEAVGETAAGLERLDELAEDAPAVNLVNSLFLEALRLNASDLHLELREGTMAVRCRVDGLLRDSLSVPRAAALAAVARLKLLAGLNILESRLPQDGRMDIAIGDQRFDVRVSVLPAAGGESLVLRLFPERQTAFELEELGLSDTSLAALRRLQAVRDGLILATGPTGCGKSTTIHALLRRIDKKSNKIVTLEDPVESVLDGAVQIQVRDELGLSFEALLKRLFRHDPDVIMLGEIRDPKSAELAMRAALTGHLVYSTLHTNDALSTLGRLYNLGIEAWLLASVVRALIAQRLLRRLCPSCRLHYRPGRNEGGLFRAAGLPVPERLYRAGACSECAGTGYRGRLAVMEIVRLDDELTAAISRRTPVEDLRRLVRAKGGTGLRQDALLAASRGLCSLEEVERELASPQAMPGEDVP